MLALNYRDSQPIYSQIRDGLRKLILSGALEPGEKLPSVRAMSTDLAINPTAIRRAYDELEAEGVIYSVPGKGSFAGEQDTDKARKQALLEELRALLDQLRALGVTTGELIAVIEEGSGND